MDTHGMWLFTAFWGLTIVACVVHQPCWSSIHCADIHISTFFHIQVIITIWNYLGKKKIYTITSICNLLVFRIPALYMERKEKEKKKKKHRINNVAAAPVPPWTDLFWLDYWVNWGPLPTKSQLTFRALSQFIHIPCVIEERHNPICVSQYPAPVFSIAAYNSLIHLNFCLM